MTTPTPEQLQALRSNMLMASRSNRQLLRLARTTWSNRPDIVLAVEAELASRGVEVTISEGHIAPGKRSTS